MNGDQFGEFVCGYWGLKGWWNQVAIRPKEGGIYGTPVSGNNQIVCKQAHLRKFEWNLFGEGHQFSLHTAKIFC